MLSVLSAAFPPPGSAGNIRGPTFTMPASLAQIEDEAFADNFALREIWIPASVLYIADNAFEGCNEITILAEADSYAAEWAREHDMAFTPVAESAAERENLSKLLAGELAILLSFVSVSPVQLIRLRRRAWNAMRSMRPQDRAELNPIDYRFP
jgi:hypothetical protein